MKRHICISLFPLILIMATAAWAAHAPYQPSARRLPAGRINQPVAQNAVKSHYRQLAAQAWLKSIGYNLTLEQMQHLKHLSLQKYTVETANLITDQNMIHLQQLPNLEELLVHRLIGDAGVMYFASLKKLKLFNMGNSRLTDRGLSVIAGMTHLENLVIPAHQHITDAGVAKLSTLKHLRLLNLTRTKITDASMPVIVQNRNMEKLFLSFTGITDAAIPYLAQLHGLQRLDIQGTGITQTGLAQLKAALPNTRIIYP